jgi:hypothetical protein
VGNKYFQLALLLLWAAVPLTIRLFKSVWDQLPMRMATHFNLNGQPNGWMSRDTAFWFAVGITVFLLMVFTVITTLMQRLPSPGFIRWVMLGFAYAMVGFIYAVNTWVVKYNLTNQKGN